MKKRNLLNGFVILTSVILGYIFVSMLRGDYFLSKLLFAITLCVAIFDGVFYALSGYGLCDGSKSAPHLPLGYIFSLSGLILLFYSPLIMEGFFFHDDYINFAGIRGGNGFFEFTMTQGRQVTGLLTDLMNYITVQNSWHLRIFSVICIIIYALIIAQTFCKLSATPVKASGMALILSILTPVINVAAYGSMFCYPLAFAFSARGTILFWETLKSNNSLRLKFVSIFWGGFLIVLSNFVYQATATMAFPVILILYLYDKEHPEKNFPILATIGYVLSTGIYYVAIKLISATQSTNLMGRASIVSSVNEIINKITWFGDVFFENLKQLASSFVGSNAFLSPWMHYLLYFKSNVTEKLSVGILLVLLLVGLVRVIKNKHLWGLIQVLAMFPLSYYVFLILSESSYTSYYSVALCSTILLIVIYGLESIFDAIFRKLKVSDKAKQMLLMYLSGACIFVALLNGSYYINNFWVDYNSYGYNFLKQSIQQNYENQNRIHVIGSLYPGQADIYATSAARIASRELGLPYNEIIFTSSSNEEYINPLTLEVYNEMLSSLPEEDQITFSSCYEIDYNFGICTLNPDTMYDDKYATLTDIFNKTGVIPSEHDESVLLIDIQGVNAVLTAQ